MDQEFEFSIADRQSSAWLLLKEYLRGRLELLRQLNDHEATEVETATLRGRIAEFAMLMIGSG